MDARIVLVAYKPKAGKQEELRQLMREHYAILKSQNLVTNRASILMEAKDETIIEVFEWASETAMQQAHTHSVIQDLWQQYAAVCDYVPVAQVAETAQLFSSFKPFV